MPTPLAREEKPHKEAGKARFRETRETRESPAERIPRNCPSRPFLEKALQNIITHNMTTEQTKKSREKLLTFIHNGVERIFGPNLELKVFGSVGMGIDMQTSDLDIVLLLGKEGTLRGDASRARAVLSLVHRWLRMECRTEYISGARVPIIKCHHWGVDCDIAYGITGGYKAAGRIKGLCEMFPQLSNVIRIVKLWVKTLPLPKSDNRGLSSYGWILLVSFFFAFDRPSEDKGICDLFLEMLIYYTEDFDRGHYGISLINGHPIPKHKLRCYRPSQKMTKPMALCIEDPLDPLNDVAGALYSETHDQILDCMNYAKQNLVDILDLTPDHERGSLSKRGMDFLRTIFRKFVIGEPSESSRNETTTNSSQQEMHNNGKNQNNGRVVAMSDAEAKALANKQKKKQKKKERKRQRREKLKAERNNIRRSPQE